MAFNTRCRITNRDRTIARRLHPDFWLRGCFGLGVLDSPVDGLAAVELVAWPSTPGAELRTEIGRLRVACTLIFGCAAALAWGFWILQLMGWLPSSWWHGLQHQVPNYEPRSDDCASPAP